MLRYLLAALEYDISTPYWNMLTFQHAILESVHEHAEISARRVAILYSGHLWELISDSTTGNSTPEYFDWKSFFEMFFNPKGVVQIRVKALIMKVQKWKGKSK